MRVQFHIIFREIIVLANCDNNNMGGKPAEIPFFQLAKHRIKPHAVIHITQPNQIRCMKITGSWQQRDSALGTQMCAGIH